MSNQLNHIDQWLQQSAEQGCASFEEAHWLQMKLLLQEKKKRRAFFWWWLGLLIFMVLGTFSLFIYNTYKNKSSNKQLISATHQKIHLLEKGNEFIRQENMRYYKNDSNIKRSNFYYYQKQESIRKPNTEKINKKVHSLNTIVKKNNKEFKQKNNSLKNLYSHVIENKHVNNFLNIKYKTTHIKLNNTNEQEISSRLNNDSLQVFNSFQKKQLIPILLNYKLPQLILIDTFHKTSKFITDTSQKQILKKKTEWPKKWSLGIGYFTGNLPLESKGIHARIAYIIPLQKKWALQVSTGVFQFSSPEQQTFKSIPSINPILGTNLVLVNISETLYGIANGLVLQPQLSLIYQIKKIELEVGWSKSFVTNGNNTAVQSSDTSIINSLPLPSQLRVNNYTYNNSNFNGKQSSNISIGLQYATSKRTKIGIAYQFQISKNTVEGVLDNNKKRNQFLFQYGINF